MVVTGEGVEVFVGISEEEIVGVLVEGGEEVLVEDHLLAEVSSVVLLSNLISNFYLNIFFRISSRLTSEGILGTAQIMYNLKYFELF